MGSGSSSSNCSVEEIGGYSGDLLLKELRTLEQPDVLDEEVLQFIRENKITGTGLLELNSIEKIQQLYKAGSDTQHQQLLVLVNAISTVLGDLEIVRLHATLKSLPEALETAIYVHEKQPVVHDRSGQAARFFKYQRGSFLCAGMPTDMEKENLRRCLVGALKHGATLTIHFDALNLGLENFFDPDHFPEAVLNRGELFKQTTWEPLLRSDKGDPSPIEFLPRDEFKLVAIYTGESIPKTTARKMVIIEIKAAEEDSLDDDPVASAMGYKEIKRNSEELIEAAFDGDLDEVKLFLEKGFHIESEDPRKHTALSEAACQGHNNIIDFLVEQGANPNACNDEGRSPLYRASYNGHIGTVKLLLQYGADPRLATKQSETAFDIAKTEEMRQILADWDTSVTDRLAEERQKAINAKLEERIKTHAEREHLACLRLREDLIKKTIAGDLDGLKQALLDIANDAERNSCRPRGTAEVRDERGCTLLALAAQHNQVAIAKLLLTHWQTCDDDNFAINKAAGERSIESRVFRSNPNSRDSKGWTPAAIAVFHNSKACLSLLLEHGADPTLRNQYHKNAFDLAQDELDAAGNVMKSHEEVLLVLQAWESKQLASTLEGAKLKAEGQAEPLPKDGGATQLAIEHGKEQDGSSKVKSKSKAKKGSKSPKKKK